MLPEKEPDVEIINDEPEENLDTPSSVTVDLDKKPESKPDVPKETKTAQPDLSKLNNTIAYQTRQLEKAMREMAEMRTQLNSRPQTVQKEAPQTQDEIDEIAQKDWKLGVKKVVEKDIEAQIQQALEKREQARLEAERKTASVNELEKSKSRVLDRYPTIEDQGSEEQRLYLEVINEDSTLLSNIHGPEIAMYRMEEKLRTMGRMPQGVKPLVDKEVNRLARAGASSVVGRQASTNGKITLTKEQKEFCDHYGVPYEQYAKNLKAQDARGGVEA